MSLDEAQERILYIFGSKDAAVAWFDAEQPSLDYHRPIDLIETKTGREAVRQVLGRIEHGVYT